MMFFGEFEYKLDEKGRLPLPPRFRRYLKDGVVLIPGPEKCITVYPLAEWRKVADTLATGSLAPSKIRTLNRALFATAFHMALDSAGRISLPAPLRDFAGIYDEAIVAGVNKNMELWSPDEWAVEKASSQVQAWQIIESLEQK